MKGFSKPCRSDRNRNRLGALIYIREDIPSEELNNDLLIDIEETYIELNIRKIKLVGYFLVGTIYHLNDMSIFSAMSRTVWIN